MLKDENIIWWGKLDAWIHAAVNWDGNTMLIYKNGVQVGSMPKAGQLNVDPGVNMAIGNQSDGAENRPFDGIIDDVAIWNRIYSPARKLFRISTVASY